MIERKKRKPKLDGIVWGQKQKKEGKDEDEEYEKKKNRHLVSFYFMFRTETSCRFTFSMQFLIPICEHIQSHASPE